MSTGFGAFTPEMIAAMQAQMQQPTAGMNMGGAVNPNAVDMGSVRMPVTDDSALAGMGMGMGAAPTRVNDFSQLKPGEQMSWDVWAGSAFGAPKDQQITFQRGMPRMPGTGGPNSTGIDVGDGQGGVYNDPNVPAGGSAKGRWRYLGNNPADYGQTQGDQPMADNARGVWQWEEDAKPQMAMPGEEIAPEKKAERFPEGDIYNDWDYFQKRARADVEGINRMPFTFSDYPNVGQTKADAMNQFYPGAWQKGGVQPIIGPNGQNIATELSPEVLKLFRDGKVDTATAKDWPSLIESLLKSKRIDAGTSQALLDMAKPKKLDTSFQSSSLMGMGLG